MAEDKTCENCKKKGLPCSGPVPTEKAKARKGRVRSAGPSSESMAISKSPIGKPKVYYCN